MNDLIPLGQIFAGAAPGANTDMFSSALEPGVSSIYTMRVTCAFASETDLNVMISDGTTTSALKLNRDAAVVAESLYTFTFAVSWDYTYNFQITVDGAIRLLIVEGVTWGVI